jgi:hypothetical protein
VILCIKERVYIACSVSAAAHPHHAFEFFSDCASDLCMVLALHHTRERVFNMSSSSPIMLGQSAEMMKEKGKLTSEEEEGERERERKKHTPLESQQSATKF